ncbi:hypothetical protein [Fulvivirga kasyanovii]|uniref:Uncharacterized protein n=1 Tax=Fulvivirga kasyanovii TaxID=396812 RepID=A0ABW9RLM5_9BACT|nr:hypothetical protein [Fulvivirga kasyanovii]MTI24992.1 hypothetical protein [Fulvivirga kasyanovii]
MKKLKYITVLSLIFGAFAFACNEDVVRPEGGGGDDEDDDPVVIPPPPPSGRTASTVDLQNIR